MNDRYQAHPDPDTGPPTWAEVLAALPVAVLILIALYAAIVLTVVVFGP